MVDLKPIAIVLGNIWNAFLVSIDSESMKI